MGEGLDRVKVLRLAVEERDALRAQLEEAQAVVDRHAIAVKEFYGGWREVAYVLGVTPQAAQQRYRNRTTVERHRSSKNPRPGDWHQRSS